MPAGFPFGSKWQKPNVIAYHNPPQKSITLTVITAIVPALSRFIAVFVVDIGLTGNTPCDIPYPLELHAHC